MLKPVHALVGTDLFMQLQTLGELLAAAPKDVQRMDFDGETAELSQVLDELRSFAMFSSAKMVVVRNGDDFITRFREALEHYVSKPSAGSTLVLRVNSLPKNQRIYKQIVANGQVHECEPPKDIVKWIVERGRRAHQLKIDLDAARALDELVGKDLGKLDNELAKLALQTDGYVDAQTINKSIAFQREQEMWDLTNEMAMGNTTAAMQRWIHRPSFAR
jgi:DNA polymerase III subunit delta